MDLLCTLLFALSSSSLVISYTLPSIQRQQRQQPPWQQEGPQTQPQTPCEWIRFPSSLSAARAGFVEGPPVETRPDYDEIHGPLGKSVDDVFMTMFRSKMAESFGFDSDLPETDYQGLMELVNAANSRYSDRTEIQKRAQETLRKIFPSWMPSSYAVLFSKPFPELSCRMNAWATYVAGHWLMGECQINDAEIDGGKIGKDHGVLVKRCRFLEESGCASVCVNACKIPTQNFFIQDMGLPLTMTPDYETYECQFSFGKTPDSASEFDAKATPCLSRCPTAGGLRKWHDGSQPCNLMDTGPIKDTNDQR